MHSTLVIFDCDGVLVDSEYLIASVEAEVFSSLGYPLTPEEDIRKFSGKSQKSTIETIEVALGKKLPPTTGQEIDQKISSVMAEKLQPTLDVEYILNKIEDKCVASSSSYQMIKNSLTITNLKPYFIDEVIFSTAMVRNGKPAPDIFLHAAATMQYLPKDCIVIEDSFAGVAAAKAAGMRVIGYTGASHIIEEDHAGRLLDYGAEKVFTDMKDLYDDFLIQVM